MHYRPYAVNDFPQSRKVTLKVLHPHTLWMQTDFAKDFLRSVLKTLTWSYLVRIFDQTNVGLAKTLVTILGNSGYPLLFDRRLGA